VTVLVVMTMRCKRRLDELVADRCVGFFNEGSKPPATPRGREQTRVAVAVQFKLHACVPVERCTIVKKPREGLEGVENGVTA
jgi:hypothetical protein